MCNKGIFQNNKGTVTSVISRETFYSMQSEKFVEETFDGSLPAFLAAFTARKSLSPSPSEGSVNPMQVFTFIASIVWIAGVAAMLLYTLVSFLRLYGKVREAVPFRDNIWICDRIATPFILGIFRPRIYLPSSVGENDREFVLFHEKAHLRRRDHIWKPLGFLLLTVYWFNPLLWVAYIIPQVSHK